MQSALQALNTLKHPILSTAVNFERESTIDTNIRRSSPDVKTEDLPQKSLRTKAAKRAAADHLTSWTLQQISSNLIDNRDLKPKFTQTIKKPEVHVKNGQYISTPIRKLIASIPEQPQQPEKSRAEVNYTENDEKTQQQVDNDSEFTSFISELQYFSSKIKKTLNAIDDIDLQLPPTSDLFENKFSNFIAPSASYTEASLSESLQPSGKPTLVIDVANTMNKVPIVVESRSNLPPVLSNYGRFINDQCVRKEIAIGAEFHMRMLDIQSKSLIEELGNVNNSIETRKEKGIDIKFDMAIGQTEDTSRVDEDEIIGNTPALRAQMHWLDDIQQLIVQVQEFVNEAFQSSSQIESVSGKCDRFKSLCLGKTRRLIFSERKKIEQKVNALNDRVQQQEKEMASLRAAIEYKQQSIEILQEESTAARLLIDSRYKAITDRYEETISTDNEKIAIRKAKLVDMLSTEFKWKELLQEIKGNWKNTTPTVRSAAEELVKDLLEEIKVEKGKEKLAVLQKELQLTIFEVKELSEAVKLCTTEESTLKEKVKVVLAQIEEETKTVRVKLNDVSKVSQEISAAVGELEEATFERKRKDKNKLREKYRINAFRLGNKVPTSAGSMGFGISESDIAHDRAALFKEQNSQLQEESATLFLIPRPLSPSPIAGNTVRVASPKTLNMTPVVANENPSLTNVNLVEFPNQVDENASSLFDKRTEELLNITKNELKRESLLKAGHSLIRKNLDMRKSETGMHSPRKVNAAKASVNRKPAIEKENDVKTIEGTRSEKDGATTHMNSIVCTAFYWNYLNMEQEHDVDVINKKYPAFHLVESTSEQYGELQKNSRWRYNNFLGHAKTILKNRLVSKKATTNSGPLYSMRDALTVLRGVLVTLTRCSCIEQSDSVDIDKDIAFISTGLLFTKANSVEAEDLRYRMHICCNKILMLAFSKGAKIVILRNSKKLFADILSCCFALVGVIINCSLRNNVPWSHSKFIFRSTSAVEASATNIVQIVTFQFGARIGTKSLNKTPSSTAPAALLDSFGMILNIFHEVEFLFLSTFDERADTENTAIKTLLQSIKTMLSSATSSSHMSLDSHYQYSIDHRNAIYAIELGLFALFNCKNLDGSYLSSKFDQIINGADKDVFGLKDTASVDNDVPIVPCDIDELLLAVCPQIIPAILACELLRQVIEKHLKKCKFLEDLKNGANNAADLQYLNVGQPPEMDMSIAQLHQQQEQQQEEEDKKEEKNEDSNSRSSKVAPSVSESVQQPSVSIRKTKTGPGFSSSSTTTLATTDTSESQTALIQKYSLEIGTSDDLKMNGNAASGSLIVDNDVVPSLRNEKEAIVNVKTDHFYESPALFVSQSGATFTLPQTPPTNKSSKKTTSTLRKQHFKDSTAPITSHPSPNKVSAVTLHMRWLMDMELYMQSVCRHIFSIIKPYALNPPALLDRIISSVSSLTLGGTKSNIKLGVQHTLDFPLHSSLAYQIINHIENVRLLALAHHPDGEQRVQRTAEEFFDIIDQLRKAREKMLNVVTAMAWPMKKKLDWLKIKYKIACEEFMRNATELQGIQSLTTALVAEREELHNSFLIVEKDKNHTIVNTHSRGLPKNTLALAAHSGHIQKKIMDHVTNGNRVKLANLLFTENELQKVIASLEAQNERAEKMNENLEIAYKEMIASGKVVVEVDSKSNPNHTQQMSYTTPGVHDMHYGSVLESVKNGSTLSVLKFVNPPAPNYFEFLDSALSDREAYNAKGDFDGNVIRSRLPSVAMVEEDSDRDSAQLKVSPGDGKREKPPLRSADKPTRNSSRRRLYSLSKSNIEQFFDLSRRSSPLDVGSPVAAAGMSPKDIYFHELDLSYTNELNRIHSSKAAEKELLLDRNRDAAFSANNPKSMLHGHELDLSFTDELNRIHSSSVPSTQPVALPRSREQSPFISTLKVGSIEQSEYNQFKVNVTPSQEESTARFPPNNTVSVNAVQTSERQHPRQIVNTIPVRHSLELDVNAEITIKPTVTSDAAVKPIERPNHTVSGVPGNLTQSAAHAPVLAPAIHPLSDVVQILHTQPNISSAVKASYLSSRSGSASKNLSLSLVSPTIRNKKGPISVEKQFDPTRSAEHKNNFLRAKAVITDELLDDDESVGNFTAVSLSSYVDVSSYKMAIHSPRRLGEAPKISPEMHYTNTKLSKPANNTIPSPEKLLPTIVEKKQIVSKQTNAKNSKVALPKGGLKERSEKTLQAPLQPSTLIIKTLSFAPCISEGLQPTLIECADSPSKEDSVVRSQDTLKTLGGSAFNTLSTGIHEIIMGGTDSADARLINIASLESDDPRTVASAIAESAIHHATRRILSTSADAMVLKQELEFQIAELQHFDRLVEKEMKKTMQKASTIHPSGEAHYKAWATNRKERFKVDAADLSLRGRGAHFKALIEAQRNRMAVMQKKSRSYFIVGDKWGNDFKQNGVRSEDDDNNNPQKETQLQVERISKMPFVVTARDLLKEQEILDHLHRTAVDKTISSIDCEHTKEKSDSNAYADDEERSYISLASLSEMESTASVLQEGDDDALTDFTLSEIWTHQSLSTPPRYAKPSARSVKSGRKITETARA